MAYSHPHPWSGTSGGPGDLYASPPPWDIGRPQPALLGLARAGLVRGRVLDAGCGTGEHTLMAASLGLDATGIDLASACAPPGTRKPSWACPRGSCGGTPCGWLTTITRP